LHFAVGLGELFTPGDEVGAANAFFDRRMGGSDLIQVSATGDFASPGAVARVLRASDLLEGTKAFADVRSFAQVVAFLGRGLSGLHRVPTDREALHNVFFFLEGADEVRSLLSDDRREAMIVLRVPQGSTDFAGLANTASQALDASAATGPAAAKARLAALQAACGIALPAGRLDGVMAALAAPERDEERAARRREVLARLEAYLASSSSPFQPAPEEWLKLAAALESDEDGRAGRLAATVSGLAGFQALGRPALAGDVSTMLVQRSRDIDLEMRSARLTARLLDGVDKVPDAMAARVRGVVADLLAGDPPGGDAVRFRVSGFPAVQPRIEVQLRRGVWASAAIVAAVLALAALAAGWRRRPRTAGLGALAVLSTTAAVFGLGWLTGTGVDSGSATLYLLAPLAAFLLAPGTAPAGPAPDRAATVFALALAVAATALLGMGILPVVRIGAVMAMSLATAAGIAAAARRAA
jgi:hypothetical protein